MARHDVDPVLQQLVRAINESGQAAVPVTVSVHGTALTGALISQRMYFSELVEGNPLMSALEPSSGLLGKEYAKDAEAESDHHLHVRVAGLRPSAPHALHLLPGGQLLLPGLDVAGRCIWGTSLNRPRRATR